ncbi:PucR family transcriptional regulator [Peptoniphilus duerdenii]|uniref:PucR family transcriptional regulator n=1 Tax=Peptoniphilus duerdenii TaxID=507750 RepID=UPI0023F268B1|nr:PucR family transcriptional regulator [Peptoniphilus duerdenii]
MRDYITIKDLLENECFGDCNLVAGMNGLKNKAKDIVVLETPDGVSWFQGNEIVLTAGYAFINEKKYKEEFIRDAYKHKVAAICIKIGRYFGEIDNNLLNDADKYGIPLIILRKEATYSKIVGNFYEFLFNIKTNNLIEQNLAYNKLLNLNSRNIKLEKILEEVTNLIGIKVGYTRFSNNNESNILYIPIKTTDNLGYIYLDNDVELNEFQKNCITYALSLIKNKLYLEQTFLYNISQNHRVITNILLQNQNHSQSFLNSVVFNLNWKSSEFYCVYFRQNVTKKIANSDIRKFLEFKLNSYFLFNTYKDGMAIFCHIEKNKLKNTLSELIEKLDSENKYLQIGVSYLKKNFKEINLSLDEAEKISKIDKRTICFIEDFTKEKIIFDLVDTSNGKEIVNDIIGKIKEYDFAHNTQLYPTFCSFISNNMSRKDTAKELYIHAETLRYRLNKIEEITDYCFENSKELMILILSKEISDIL